MCQNNKMICCHFMEEKLVKNEDSNAETLLDAASTSHEVRPNISNLFTQEDKTDKNTVPFLEDEILQAISIERAVPQELGESISSQLAEMAIRFWKTESNSAVKLKQKETLKIPQNFREIRAPILNDSISKSKKIHPYYIRTDKRLFDIQGKIITATSALLLPADRCLDSDKNKSTVNYREIVTLQVDALLGDVSKKLTKLIKSKIKPAFGFEVKKICDKDF